MLDEHQKYESYKDSGFEWLGPIPSEWELKKSKYVWREIEDRSDHGEEQLLSVSQYDGVVPNTSDGRSESLEGYKKVYPDHLVTNIMLAWMGGLGISAHNGIVSPAYAVYKLTEDHNAYYLGYLYRTKTYLAEFARRSKGVVPSRWRMYTDDFGQVLTLLPPTDTQNRIVSFLDKKTAEIDAAIAKKRRLIDLLNEQKAILINRAVTKGLNPDAPMKESGVDWIGEIPAHWGLKRLKNLVRDGTTISYGIVQPGDHLEGGTPFVQTTNISKAKIVVSDLQCTNPKIALAYPRTKLELGDLILGIRASVGAVHIVEQDLVGVNLSRGIARIAVNNSVTASFLKSFIQSQATEEFWTVASQGTTFTEISIANVKRLPVLIPPLKEQKEIAENVEQIGTEIISAIAHVEEEISTLNEFKQTLIANAVTGKIKI